MAANAGMSDVPSVLPRDSASQGGGADVDAVGLVTAVIKPFEMYLSNAKLSSSEFLDVYDRVIGGVCRVLASGYGDTPAASVLSTSPPVAAAEALVVESGGSGTSSASVPSVSSSKKRRRRRLAALKKQGLLALDDQCAGGVSSFSGTADGLLVAPPLPDSSAFGDGFCYLQFASPGSRGKLRSLLGPTPSVVKLLAAPAKFFSLASFAGLALVRSMDSDWHVESRTGDRPLALALLRRFVSERLASTDLSTSHWHGSLVHLVRKAPLVPGAFDIPALSDRVGVASGGVAGLSAVESGLVPSDVPSLILSMAGSQYEAPAGMSFFLFRLFSLLMPKLSPLALEAGVQDLLSLVQASFEGLDQTSAAMGGDAAFGVVVDPAAVLVAGTEAVSDLQFYFRSASAIAAEVVGVSTTGAGPVLVSLGAVHRYGARAVELANAAVLRCYSLLMVLVSQLDEAELTRARCRSLVQPVVAHYDALLASARAGTAVSGCSLIQVISPLSSFSSTSFPCAKEAAFYFQGTFVEMVSSWDQSLVHCGVHVALSGSHAAELSTSCSVPVVTLHSLRGASAANVVYFSDPAGREDVQQVLNLLSLYTRRLVVVSPSTGSRLRGLLFWLSASCVVPPSLVSAGASGPELGE